MIRNEMLFIILCTYSIGFIKRVYGDFCRKKYKFLMEITSSKVDFITYTKTEGIKIYAHPYMICFAQTRTL